MTHVRTCVPLRTHKRNCELSRWPTYQNNVLRAEALFGPRALGYGGVRGFRGFMVSSFGVSSCEEEQQAYQGMQPRTTVRQ